MVIFIAIIFIPFVVGLLIKDNFMCLFFKLAQGIKLLHSRNKNFPEEKLDSMQRVQPIGGWWLWVLGSGISR